MAEVIRVGYISSVNYEEGTAQVVYKDRDNSLSPFMPLWSNEFFPPEVDTMVYVIHLQNGGTRGMIIIPPYTERNRPPEGIEGIWRKDFGDGSYLRYDKKTKQLDIICDKLTVSGDLHVDGEIRAEGDVHIGGDLYLHGTTIKE